MRVDTYANVISKEFTRGMKLAENIIPCSRHVSENK